MQDIHLALPGNAKIIRNFTIWLRIESGVLKDKREAYYEQRLRESGPHYRGFDLPSAEVMVNLLYTSDMAHQVLAPYMAEYGLSKSTVNILMILRHGPPGGMQLHDLGELLLVSRANITGLIDHLEEKGYVKRVVDATDRRARLARVTKKGEALLDEFMPVHYECLKKLLNDLSEEDKTTLVRLLKRVRASFTAREEETDKGTGLYRLIRD